MSKAVQFDELSIDEAASRLGISVAALRKRISRGAVQARKENGRLHVLLPRADTDSTNEDTQWTTEGQMSKPVEELLANLREEADRLWEELSVRTEELRRKDIIIADLARRVPALPETVGFSPAPPAPAEAAASDSLPTIDWWTRVHHVSTSSWSTTG